MSSDSEREWYERDCCGDSCARAARPSGGDSGGGHRAVDAAGENGSRHSQHTPKCRTRYINPAICVESVESSRSAASLHGGGGGEQATPHPHAAHGSSSTPHLSSSRSDASSAGISRKACLVLEADAEAEADAEDTYRAGEREDGRDTFRLSVASLDTTSTAREERERAELRRRQAFDEWCARKEREKRERLVREKKTAPAGCAEVGGGRAAPAAAAAQREECFRRWTERKRREAMRTRAEQIVHQFRSEEELDELRTRREREKGDKLSEWARRKEEKTREVKAAAERAAAAAEAREARRRSAGERAYSDWLRSSRHKPLPVPLNQGVLSMRGTVSDMYINPQPWQSPVPTDQMG